MTDNTERREALLTREQIAAELTARGLAIQPRTLATMAANGRGPPYVVFGRKPLYSWNDVARWAAENLRPPRSAPAARAAL